MIPKTVRRTRNFTSNFPIARQLKNRCFVFYQLLSEKDRRLYAATEALKLAHGGITYIAGVLNCDRKNNPSGYFRTETSG